MPKPKDRSLLEATLQNIEVAVDAVTSNTAVASIPVIGTAFNVCKGIDDIRSRAFAAKLERFVSTRDLVKPEAKAAIVRKVESSPEEANKVGETLFFVLDRLIDLDKPEILAKVFVAYVADQITAIDLQRLAQAIDIGFAGDLKAFLGADAAIINNSLEATYMPWMTTLLPSGLTIHTAGGVGAVRARNEVTPLGQLLWKAWHYEFNEA